MITNQTKLKKFQIIWWWEKPTFKVWNCPRNWSKPMFTGYVFGLFEIRIWHKEPYQE